MNLYKPAFYSIYGLIYFLCSLIILTTIWGCEQQHQHDDSEEEKPLKIVTTTGMLGDAVAFIVSTKAEVVSLMGPGVDPHLYKATFDDLHQLEEANIIIYNGLHLEGKMGEVLEKLSRTKPVVPVAEQLDESLLIEVDATGKAVDPHVWFDVSLWATIVNIIGASVSELDQQNGDFYKARAEKYADSLKVLHAWVDSSISTIPSERRVLITAHDAFGYFGAAYQIEVKGLQGISTVSEFGLKDVRDLVGFIVDRKVKAVFVESSIPKRSLEAVVSGVEQRGGSLIIGGTLYSDAMGQKETPEGTYIGMVEHNVNTIVKALK